MLLEPKEPQEPQEPQEQVQQHTVEQIVDLAPMVQILDAPGLQMVEQLPDIPGGGRPQVLRRDVA